MLCYWISTTTSFLYKFAKEKANFNGSAKGGSYDQAAITKFDVNVVAAVNLSYSLLIKNMYRDLDAWIIHSILEQKPSDRYVQCHIILISATFVTFREFNMHSRLDDT